MLTECSAKGEGAGRKFPWCRHLAGTFSQVHIFMRVSFLTQAHKPRLWKLPTSVITKSSTQRQSSDLEVDAIWATLTDVNDVFPPG